MIVYSYSLTSFGLQHISEYIRLFGITNVCIIWYICNYILLLNQNIF